jgi:hypothetical protein
MRPETIVVDIDGKYVDVGSVRVNNNHVIISGSPLRMARVREEWYEDVTDPGAIIDVLRQVTPRPDIFTFWQRLPDVARNYPYRMEPESIAMLPIKGFADWFQNQIGQDTRKLIRRAERKGCIVRECVFDDEFVKGMVRIFNETYIRQGRLFWHYGKNAETVKNEFSRYLFREQILGAYYNEELIGFIFLADAGKFGYLGQIISLIKHRDKYPNNALMAKAVEVAADRKIPYLVYGLAARGGLAEFKRRNGFNVVDVPRYYVPLTFKGSLAIRLNAHRSIIGLVPEKIAPHLRRLRERWFELRYGGTSPG